MGSAAGSPTAAGREAWEVTWLITPRRGDQARHSSDSGWYPAVVVTGPGEQRVAPGGRDPHPCRLRPLPPLVVCCSDVRAGRGSTLGGGSAEKDRLRLLHLLQSIVERPGCSQPYMLPQVFWGQHTQEGIQDMVLLVGWAESEVAIISAAQPTLDRYNIF